MLFLYFFLSSLLLNFSFFLSSSMFILFTVIFSVIFFPPVCMPAYQGRSLKLYMQGFECCPLAMMSTSLSKTVFNFHFHVSKIGERILLYNTEGGSRKIYIQLLAGKVLVSVNVKFHYHLPQDNLCIWYFSCASSRNSSILLYQHWFVLWKTFQLVSGT